MKILTLSSADEKWSSFSDFKYELTSDLTSANFNKDLFRDVRIFYENLKIIVIVLFYFSLDSKNNRQKSFKVQAASCWNIIMTKKFFFLFKWALDWNSSCYKERGHT